MASRVAIFLDLLTIHSISEIKKGELCYISSVIYVYIQ